MSNNTISKILKTQLRADAHHLKPVVMIGQDGISDGVLKEIDINLQAHNLIKVRILAEDSRNNKEIADILCRKLQCHLIQGIGKLLVLYREGEVVLEHAQIEQPIKKAPMPAPKEVKVRKMTRGPRRSPIKILTVLGNQRVTAGGLVKRKKVRQVSKKKQFSD
ncbi:MAG: hypothetical protein RLZZ210_1374 [Pseudomonadota bacterium]|jgi:putative YhbY family RNA-binding protein